MDRCPRNAVEPRRFPLILPGFGFHDARPKRQEFHPKRCVQCSMLPSLDAKTEISVKSDAISLLWFTTALLAPMLGAAVAAVLLRSTLWYVVAALIWVVQRVAIAADYALHLIVTGLNSAGTWLGSWGWSIGQDWSVLRPDALPPQSAGFDLGLGTFGVAVLFTTLDKALVPIASRFKHWRGRDPKKFWEGSGLIFVAFLGLWFSVYGLKVLSAAKEPSYVLGFDTRAWPIQRADPEHGTISFYVSFAAEAGRRSFDLASEANIHTVTLSEGDKSFLGRLADALNACGTTEKKAKVSLHGFASSSYWSQAKGELEDMVRRAPVPIESPCRIDVARLDTKLPKSGTQSPPIPDQAGMIEALACVGQYKATSVRQSGWTNEPISDAQAFNLYLANRRQAEVAHALNASAYPNLMVESVDWQDYGAMEAALVIDDATRGQDVSITGLLTRSVQITVADASACTKKVSASIQVLHLDIK